MAEETVAVEAKKLVVEAFRMNERWYGYRFDSPKHGVLQVYGDTPPEANRRLHDILLVHFPSGVETEIVGADTWRTKKDE